jgi:hypothetical protein
VDRSNRLSNILPGDDGDDEIARLWAMTTPAADLGPLPAGKYQCRILRGERFTAKTGTKGYKITFEIVDGDHAGRRAWHDLWFTLDAMGQAKRDLNKIGISRLDQLDRPLPPGMLASIKLALRKENDGTERNEVKDFRVTGIEPAEPEPFSPIADAADADGFDWTTGQQTGGQPA